jgi:hypothetical protein
VGHERVGPPGALSLGQTFECRDRSPGDSPNRRDAGDPRVIVDPDRAAPALALRAASVLQGATPQLVAQRVEQRDPVVDGHGIAVEDEIYARRNVTGHGSGDVRWATASRRSGRRERSGAVAQLKEEPQPHVRVALGLLMLKPAPCNPSL